MNKAPDAFRTISEVAAELELPQHVLRFWESRFPHIRPMKRGGGRRYYRPDDVELLRGIRHLLYGQGYTIRGVQRILREQGPRFVQTVWQEGAPQPPHLPEPEELEADESEDAAFESEAAPAAVDTAQLADLNVSAEPQRREPTFTGDVAAAAPSVENPSPAAMEHGDPEKPTEPSRPAGLQPADRDSLQSALATLGACKQLLEDAFAEAEQSP